MRVQVHSARVYGSKSQYGNIPRRDPLGGPLVVSGFPSNGRAATIVLGDVAEAVKTASRVRRTLARMAARAFGGHQEGEDKQAVAERLFASDEMAFPTESWNWYVTAEISGPAEVPDAAILDRKFGWIEPGESLRLLETFAEECAPHLDRLVSYLALFIEEGFFSNPVAEITFLAADGRLPIAWPTMEGAWEFEMTYAASRLDVGGLREFAPHLSKHQEPAKSPLDTPRHWFLHAIGEEDAAKRFMMCFWGLEVLTNKLTPKATPMKRFRRLQQVLGLQTEESDLTAFKKVKTARDRLSHGEWYNLESLPTSEAYRLMKKYFLAALRRKLAQAKPAIASSP